MLRQILLNRARLAVSLGMLLALTVACSLGAQPSDNAQITATAQGGTPIAQSNVPEIEIQTPADNTEVVINSTVQIYVRATDQIGVTRIEMRADNLIVDSTASPDPNGSPTLESILSWTPNAGGAHVLQVIAYRGSLGGNPKNLNITVRSSAAEVTLPAGSPQYLTASPTIDPFCNVSANVSNLNVRTGPGINYDIIGTLALGQPVPVSGTNDDRSWWQINQGGAIGWVSASYSTISGVCSNVLIVPVPASPTVPFGATPIFIPPSFTPRPQLPTAMPTQAVRVVILPTLTFTPGPSGPQPFQLTTTAILATQTALAIPTIAPTLTPFGLIPTATPSITPIPALPNLIVSAASVPGNTLILDPSKPVTVGQLTITVANVGAAPANRFRVSIQQPDGTLAFATTAAPLQPGTQINLSTTLFIAHTGITRLTIIADSDNAIAESSKSDNVLVYDVLVVGATALPNAPTATSTLTYTPPPTSTNTPPPTATLTPVPSNVALPNLVVQGVQLAQDPIVLAGSGATTSAISVIVANLGNGPAGTFLVGLTLSDGRQVAGTTATSLNPGAQTTVILSVPFSTAGTYQLTAIADSGNTIAESNEADNVFARTVLVVGGNSGIPTATPTLTNTPNSVVILPSLVITGVQLSDAEANSLQAARPANVAPPLVHVLVTVSNTGNGPAAPFQVAVVLPSGQQFLGSSTQPLAPAAKTVVAVPVTFTQGGAIALTVIVNPNNAVPDANTNNKTFNLTVQVGGTAPTTTPTATAAPVQPSHTLTALPPSATRTNSPVPVAPKVTNTATATRTNSPVPVAPKATNTATATRTNSPVPVAPKATNTATATRTNSPVPVVPKVTNTSTLTATATRTNSPVPNAPQPTHTATATNTATATRTNSPVPNVPTNTHTPSPAPQAILSITGVTLAAEPIVIDPKNPAAPVPVTILIANTGSAPSAAFSVSVQAGANPPVVVQVTTPIAPNTQTQVVVNVTISQVGPVHLVVTLTAPSKAPITVAKDTTVVLKPTPIPPTAIPATATHTATPSPAPQANLGIAAITLAAEPIVIDPKNPAAPVPVTILIANTGNAPSAAFTLSVQVGTAQPVAVQVTTPIAPGKQLPVLVNVTISQPGPVHLVVTLNVPPKAPIAVAKDTTAVLKPTPIPPTAVPPTAVPPTVAKPSPVPPPTTVKPSPVPATAAPTAAVLPPTAPPAGQAPDFLTLPVLPVLANDPALLANLKALYAKATTGGAVPNLFVVVGDDELAALKNLKADTLKLDKADLALRDAATFFAPSYPLVTQLPTISPLYNAASLLVPDGADTAGACKGKAPLQCAADAHPTFVLINVGSLDIKQNTPGDAFQNALQAAVSFVAAHNAIPVLVTIPSVDNPTDEPKLPVYNTIIYNVAKAANIPLLNLYGGLRTNNPNPPLIAANGSLTTGGAEPGNNLTADGLKFGANAANRDILRLLDLLKKTLLTLPGAQPS